MSGVNFAGKFSVVEIGCGTSCRFTFAVDVSNGKVVTFPYGGKEQYQLGLGYSTDSRLMRATWREVDWVADQSKDTDTCISHDILWTGSDFKIMSERAFEIKKSDHCSISYKNLGFQDGSAGGICSFSLEADPQAQRAPYQW